MALPSLVDPGWQKQEDLDLTLYTMVVVFWHSSPFYCLVEVIFLGNLDRPFSFDATLGVMVVELLMGLSGSSLICPDAICKAFCTHLSPVVVASSSSKMLLLKRVIEASNMYDRKAKSNTLCLLVFKVFLITFYNNWNDVSITRKRNILVWTERHNDNFSSWI